MIGSLVILDVADKAAAQEWADNDPYAKAGLFADVAADPLEPGDRVVAYWLFKSEPSAWGWQDQVAKGAAGEEWDGRAQLSGA